MEDLDCHCCRAGCFPVNGSWWANQVIREVHTKGVICRERHEWPQVFPTPGKKFPRQLGCNSERIGRGIGISLCTISNDRAKSFAQTISAPEAHNRLLLKKLRRFAK